MVELSELAEHCSRLVSVLGHGTGQRVGRSSADGLLVMGDVSDQQRAEFRDKLQIQRLPEPEDEGEDKNLAQLLFLLHDYQ